MNKQDLVELVAARNNLSKVKALQVVGSVFDAIESALAGGEHFTMAGFGTMKIVKRAPRPGRNPLTGQSVPIPATLYPKFTPSPLLKKRLGK